MGERDRTLAELLRRAVEEPASVDGRELADALDVSGTGAAAGNERRGSARLGVEVPAELRDAQHPEAGSRQALITDVGPGGARLRVRGLPPQSHDVVLEFRRSRFTEPMSVPGRLTWTRPERWSTCAGVELSRESSFAWFAELRDLARESAHRH